MYAISDAEYQAQFIRTKESLAAELDRGRRGARRSLIVGIGASVALAATLLFSGIGFAGAAFLLLLVLTFVWAIVFLSIQHYDGIAESAAAMTDLLQRERSDTEALFALVSSGAPFALFLRSFASEAEGLGNRGLKAMLELDARQARLRSRYDDFGYMPDMSHFDAHAKWSAECAVVGILAAHFPVVLLGNLRLAADMTTDLDRLGVKSLTIQAQDWYPVFEALASKAQIVLFYIEQVSPSLKREIVYAGANRLAYVIVGSPDDLAQIAASFESGAAFVSGARAVAAPDHPDIPGLLTEVIGGHAA